MKDFDSSESQKILIENTLRIQKLSDDVALGLSTLSSLVKNLLPEITDNYEEMASLKAEFSSLKDAVVSITRIVRDGNEPLISRMPRLETELRVIKNHLDKIEKHSEDQRVVDKDDYKASEKRFQEIENTLSNIHSWLEVFRKDEELNKVSRSQSKLHNLNGVWAISAAIVTGLFSPGIWDFFKTILSWVLSRL